MLIYMQVTNEHYTCQIKDSVRNNISSEYIFNCYTGIDEMSNIQQ